jgi:hypothetical protein
MKSITLESIHPEIGNNLLSDLYCLFPELYAMFVEKHKEAPDDSWVENEIIKIYRTHYDTTAYSATENRRRQLCWLTRTGQKKTFLALSPTQEELTHTTDPIESLSRLCDLIRQQQPSWLQDIYEQAIAPAQATDSNTTLLWAVYCNHSKAVRRLIKANADVNAAMANGITSLYIATQYGHSDIVRQLIDARASVNAAMANGATPLLVAAQNGHIDIVRQLIDARAGVNAATTNGATPLYIAAQNGNS